MDEASKNIQSDMQSLLTEWLGVLEFEAPVNWLDELTELNSVLETTEENASTQCTCTIQLINRVVKFLDIHSQVYKQMSEMLNAFHIISMAQAEMHNSVLDLTGFDFDKITSNEWGSLSRPHGVIGPPEHDDDEPEEGPENNGTEVDCN
jgi:hypothetical protein